MNIFLEEKEKLLNSIENNTPNHWKEYYKNVPLDCIFDDLVLDVNEIKRLTEENKQLKGSLQTHEILLKANVGENQELKSQLRGTTHCYDEEEHKRLQEENKELKKQIKIKHDGFMASVEEACELAEENQQLKEQLQQKEDIINKAKEHLELKVIRYSNETDYMLDETDLKEIIEILDNKGE